MKKYKSYIISVLIALAVGGLSALLTQGSNNIYETLNQPPLSPPAWLFPVVWSILFVLMGISSAGVWESLKDKGQTWSSALTVYAINLGMNFLWSIVFFNLQAFFFAFVWLILLIGVIIKMISDFRKERLWTGNLQIPYLLWCIFALYLNFGIYVLN
ncbi:MAG: tryptophan-rich sensory protein [Ruminococcaceae bacterium]|nr:tryptophan-rich sensory protein [Oscillospiraceae bacterium]